MPNYVSQCWENLTALQDQVINELAKLEAQGIMEFENCFYKHDFGTVPREAAPTKYDKSFSHLPRKYRESIERFVWNNYLSRLSAAKF